MTTHINKVFQTNRDKTYNRSSRLQRCRSQKRILKLYKHASFQIFNNSNPEEMHLIEHSVGYSFCLELHTKAVWVSLHLNQLT